jgi:hypothetical protein
MKNQTRVRQSLSNITRTIVVVAIGLAAGCAPADTPSEVPGPPDAGTLEAASRDQRTAPEAEAEAAVEADTRGDVSVDASINRRDEAEPVVDTRADVFVEAPDASARGGDEVARFDAPSHDQDLPGLVQGIIGVGYGGLRIVSRDQGRTWGSRAAFAANGVDDENLLRAVVYGKGLWIATGWKLVTSTDGVHWTDHGLITKLPEPRPACNIIEGLAFKEQTFYAACSATLFRSDDGLQWTPVGPIGNTGAHLFLTYRAGQLVAYGDTKTSFSSVDGAAWSILPGVQQATYCGDQFRSQADCGDSSWFDGVYLRPDWKGKVLRSADGIQFDQVYVDDMQNTVYEGRAFAEGYVAP